jgi:hypothetical protein
MKNLTFILLLCLVGVTQIQANIVAPEPQKEEVYDILLDCFFIGMDIGEIIATCGTSGWVSLGADIGCAFTPGATGAGNAIRVGKNIHKGCTATEMGWKGSCLIKFSPHIKKLSNIRITKSFVKDNLEHAFKKHVVSRSQGSYFIGISKKNRNKFLELAEECIGLIGTKSSNTFVRPNGSLSAVVMLDRPIGKSGNQVTEYVMLHYNPNFKSGHKFSMYPVTFNYAMNFKGLKKQYL